MSIKLAQQIAAETSQNGSDMYDAIGKLADILTEAGYHVTDTGSMMVYPYEGDIRFTKDGVAFNVKTSFEKAKTDA